MACVNPNDPEFRKILEEIKNPLLAEVAYKEKTNSLDEFGDNNVMYSLDNKEGFKKFLHSNEEKDNSSVFVDLSNIEKDLPNIIYKNGKPIGKILLENDGEYLTVNKIDIETPNKGIGTEVYKQIGEYASKNGFTFRSDKSTTRMNDASKGLWNSLERKGLARKINDHYFFETNDNLFNSIKNSNFANYDKHKLNQVLSGLIPTSEGELVQAIKKYLTGNGEPIPSAERKQSIKEQEREKLISYIDQHNFWYKENISNPEMVRGGEHVVYADDYHGTVIKYNNLAYFNSYADYFDNLLINNSLFPATTYLFKGFKEINGELNVVVEQPFIKGTNVNLNQVETILNNLGFIKQKENRNDYYNQKLGVILEDIHDENVVLSEDGIPFFIDTVFYTTKDFYNQSYSVSDIKNTKASPEVIKKVKEFLTRIGVKIEDLKRENKIQGIADFLNSSVLIGEGKTEVALTEEAMHFGLEILKQVNASLYKEMFNKIGQYKIFDITLQTYKDYPSYQNENGSPNIPKIKDEAITKLIVEFVHRNNNNEETQVEDYMTPSKQGEQSYIATKWWQKVVNWIKTKIKQTGINPFEKASKEIMSEDFKGTVKDIISQDKMLSTTTDIGEEMKQLFQKQIDDYQLTKVLDTKATIDEDGNDSHYTIINPKTGTTETIDRTTEWAKRQNKRGTIDWLANASKEDKAIWNEKANIGTLGHTDAENIVKWSLNEDGTLKPRNQIVLNFTPKSKEVYDESGELYNPIFNLLRSFLLGNQQKLGWLYTFPQGTKFILEQQLLNDVSKRAGTSDLIAIIPLEDGKYDIKVFDWKFMGINLQNGNNDQAFQKRSQHALQMQDYRNMLKNIYVPKLSNPKVINTITANTIPFRIDYSINKRTNLPVVRGIETGKVDILQEEKTYLLPVVAQGQLTGNASVDEQIRMLHVWYDKMWNVVVSPEHQQEKNDKLNKLSEAIRHLQIRMNFDRVAVEAENFKKDLQNTIDKYENIDLANSSVNDLNIQLGDLDIILKSLDTFAKTDKVFVDVYGEDNLSEKEQKILTSLKTTSRDVEVKKEAVLNIIRKYVNHIALQRNIKDILSNERELKGFITELTELGNLDLPMAKLFAEMNLARTSYDTIASKEKGDVYNKIYLAAQKALGTDPFDTIALSSDNELRLKDKTSLDFLKKVTEAKENNDKKFLLESIDKSKYTTILQERLNAQIERIQNTQEHIDSKKSKEIIKKKIVDLKKALDINRADFNGYQDYRFNSILYACLKYDEHQTAEYKELSKIPEVKALYDFLFALNEEAKETDYLPKNNWRTFLPFIEDTMINRIFKGNTPLHQSWELLKESYQLTFNDANTYGSKINKETGKPEKAVPKYFVHSKENKSIYSKDLLKIGNLYIEAIQNRKSAIMYENIFNAMYIVEKYKGHLEEEHGRVKMNGDTVEVFTGNDNNTNIILNAFNDAIYGERNIGDKLDPLVMKLAKGTEEEKEQKAINVKKGMESLMKFQQMGALGLKMMVALPNFLGNQFQAYINAGNNYKFRDYFKNESKLTTSTMSDIEKGLLDLFVPLNEDGNLKNRRATAWKQSSLKWLQTWTVQETLMSFMHIPDKMIQMANAVSWIDYTMIVNGKLENIREYVRKQDQLKYSQNNVKETEKTFESRVKELQDAKSLKNVAKFNSEGILEIPGVSKEEIAKYRSRIVEFGRRITGQMNEDNKAGYRRNILWKSFFMFKNWIPKQISVRGSDISYDAVQGTWDYGRTRLFAKTWAHLGLANISSIGKMVSILQGSPDGIKYMKEMLEEKKLEYKAKTGRELEITDEDFYDLTRQQLKNTCKEIALLLGIMAMLLAAKAAAPDDDDRRKKNRYNYMARLLNKTADEVMFYYDPTSFQSITTGSLLPAVQILGTAATAFKHTFTEITAETMDDEKKEKQNKVIKYWINLVPGANGLVPDLMTQFDADLAKDMGYRTTTQSRPQR